MKISLKNIAYVTTIICAAVGLYVRHQYPEATKMVIMQTLDTLKSYTQGHHVYLKTRDLTYGKQLIQLQHYLLRHDYDAVSQVKAALLFNLVNYLLCPPAFAFHYVAGISDTYQGNLLFKAQEPAYTTFYVQAIKAFEQALQALPQRVLPEEYLAMKSTLEPLRHQILSYTLYQKQYLSDAEAQATL